MSEVKTNEQVEVVTVDRNIKIYGNIAQDTVEEVLDQLWDIEAFDAEYLTTYGECSKLMPIVIDIFSHGGCAFSCQAIIDVLLSLKCPIICRAYGSVQSAAFLIYLTGDIRLAGKHTTMMTHEVSYDVGMNNFKVQKQELNEFSRMQRRMNDFIISRTNITEEDLTQWAGSEKYFDWDEAFNYGVVTDDLDLDFMYFIDWLRLGEEENKNEE